METLRGLAEPELTGPSVLAHRPHARDTPPVLRWVCVGILAVGSACLICDEDSPCKGGSFNVWVGRSDNAPLAEGTYTLSVTPELGPVLEGACVVSSQATRVECSGDAVAGSVGRPGVFTFLRVSEDTTLTTHLSAVLTYNGVVVDEREEQVLEFTREDACDNDCGVADVLLAPEP